MSAAQLLQAETSLGYDLDGDGQKGLTYAVGTATIGGVNLGNTQLGWAIKNGTNPSIQVTYGGAYTSASYPGAGWSAMGAAADGAGFDLYLKNTGTGQYVRWLLDATGNLSSGAILSTSELLLAETRLNTDLNGDSSTGTTNNLNVTPTALPITARLSNALASKLERAYSQYSTPEKGVIVDNSSKSYQYGTSPNSIFTIDAPTTYSPNNKIATRTLSYPDGYKSAQSISMGRQDGVYYINTDQTNTNTNDPLYIYKYTNSDAFTSNKDIYSKLANKSDALYRDNVFAELVNLQNLSLITDDAGRLKSTYFGPSLTISRSPSTDFASPKDSSIFRATPISADLGGDYTKISSLPDGNYLVSSLVENNANATTYNYTVTNSSGIVFANLQQSTNYWEFARLGFGPESKQALFGLTGISIVDPVKDYIIGTPANDSLKGSALNEMFIVNGGSDTIICGGGSDTIVFNDLIGTAKITGFNSSTTTIALDKSTFTALINNSLLNSPGSTGSPLVFNTQDSTLYYNSPNQSPLAIAVLNGTSALTPANIQLF